MREPSRIDATEETWFNHGNGAALIALVYVLVGPPVGLVLIALIVAMMVDFTASTLGAALVLTVLVPATSLPIAYSYGGALALLTGIVVGVVAQRHGKAPIWIAAAAPVAVLGAFAVLHLFVHIDILGAALMRTVGQRSVLIWLPVCIAASLLCWLITLPIQRRMR